MQTYKRNKTFETVHPSKKSREEKARAESHSRAINGKGLGSDFTFVWNGTEYEAVATERDPLTHIQNIVSKEKNNVGK